MFKKLMVAAAMVSTVFLTGCASVPMGTPEQDAALKQFNPPPANKAGLYIYRNTFAGQALKKTVTLDGTVVGETANKIFFYKEIAPGKHNLSTESEFGDNSLVLDAIAGKNYFVEQYIKIGVFVGGAALRLVEDDKAKPKVLESKYAVDNIPN